MKKTHEISILNQKFVLKSEDDEKYLHKIADYVNQKAYEIQANAQSVSTLRVALLVALNLADEYFKLQKKQKEKSEHLEIEVQKLIAMVDEAVKVSLPCP